MICPQCKNEENCNFCENTGNVSELQFKLYDLGFRIKEDEVDYRLRLNKVYSHLETLSLEVSKKEDILNISKIDYNGPYQLLQTGNLDTIERMIAFLYRT